ncbi:MAG TPA: oligosaccharide flippase family protein [Burkholderiaceae bacterium]|nr:oligosaccharide flippase family protein [Burkholderiaceae bacterium]
MTSLIGAASLRMRLKLTLQPILRLVNLKGELFASTFSYALTSGVRLLSSLILTRLLNPEAYGVMGILFSVAFMLEMISDVGTATMLIRHERGGERRFVHAAWTVRLIRSVVNFVALYALAPVIARLYDLPVLTDALRLFSLWFVLQGLESMSFALAQRDRRAKIGNYVEMATSLVMTATVIGLALALGDYTAFIYGALLQRLLSTAASHFFYREIGVGIVFDRQASREQFNFAKYVLPSGILAVILSQYDKLLILKLFDLSMLGVYGLAGNMISPVGGLVAQNCRALLYPRCADYFRHDRATAAHRYYSENTRLVAIVTLLPAAIAGFAGLLVKLLYDARYAQAGYILMLVGLGTVVSAFQQMAENLLVASGRTHVALVGNVLRVAAIAPMLFVGYRFGFEAFLCAGLVAGLPILSYFYYEQRRNALLDPRAELRRFAGALAVFGVCLLISQALMPFLAPDVFHRLLHFSRPSASH